MIDFGNLYLNFPIIALSNSVSISSLNFTLSYVEHVKNITWGPDINEPRHEKTNICICENKDTDPRQRICFRYIRGSSNK